MESGYFLVAVVSVALVAAGVIIARPFLLERRHAGPRVFRGTDDLLRAVLGDRAKAQRLADYEMERSPGIGEQEARRRAFERLGLDRWD